MNFMKGDRISLPSLVRGKRRYVAANTGIEVMMARQSSTLAKLPRRLQMGNPSYQMDVSNCWQCGCATNYETKIENIILVSNVCLLRFCRAILTYLF
jgi:hypothetical protein